MFLGLDGVELSLIIVFITLFASILSGYPVAFAISGAAAVSYLIIAILSENGLLYVLETHNGVTEQVPVLAQGWKRGMLSTLSTWAQGVFSRAFGGNVETLLAVPMFVLMGITLERSRIAEELLVTMAKLFGAIPGGLAISVVFVGTLLAASTGIVGATVVTMGLIALPTMLQNGYSKSLSTGVIATSGTLGQIVPPSIVIVLLGSIVGDMYAIGQENRAKELGVTVLEMLGEPAVLSTGTLFKAAFIPGIFLALLYGVYALVFALLNPKEAPPVQLEDQQELGLSAYYNNNATLMVLAIVGPIFGFVLLWFVAANLGLVESNVVPRGVSHGSMAMMAILGSLMSLALALRPKRISNNLFIGFAGLVLFLLIDFIFLSPEDSGGKKLIFLFVPIFMLILGLRSAISPLLEIDVIRVVAPPVILIVAVLGSILGGVTNPTAAASLGAVGAIMLAASRKLQDDSKSNRYIIWGGFAIIIMLLARGNFDLRMGLKVIELEDRIAIFVALIAYHIAVISLLYSCWLLIADGQMRRIVQDSTKVTTMVFAILIGSLFLSLTIRSFGGEHYIQEFLRSFDDPRVLLLVVMLVLFLLGFVLDFIEIIFIVIPIVGPVIYAADPTIMPPEWITILIAVNLQTSFITPPFGFALFYLRGVAPPTVTTIDIYRGVIPFVIIQVIALGIMWFFPQIVTFLPDLLPQS